MFRRFARPFIVAALLAGSSPALAIGGGVCDCPADLDSSGTIDTLDLGILLSGWSIPMTAPGCAGAVPCHSDLDGDGHVNSIDLGTLLSVWGDCVFNYGPAFADSEARQIGLETLGPSGPLLLSQATYNRIDHDLDLIRAHTPALATQTHTLAWSPQSLIVRLVVGARTDGYEALNDCFDVQDIDPIGFGFLLVHFPHPINVEALAAMYLALPEVDLAQPDHLIGGSNFWVPTPLPGTPDEAWQWNIDDGYGDCFDGCDCHNLYVFRTTATGDVELISYQFIGSPFCGVAR